MIYLSGVISQSLLAQPRDDLGIMFQPGMGNDRAVFLFRRWAADNGCFAQGDRFDPGDWLQWLASLRPWRGTCLFAVAPDVWGDARATLERSRAYLPTIRQLGFPAAFVAQDGAHTAMIPWEDVDVLFIGGSDVWRNLSGVPQQLIAYAITHGKRAHWGRVNSDAGIDRAYRSGCESADGTFLAYAPDENLGRLLRWLDGRPPEYQGELLGALGVAPPRLAMKIEPTEPWPLPGRAASCPEDV